MAGDEHLSGQPQPAADREERRASQRTESQRKAQERPFGQGIQPAITQDVRGARGQRRDQTIAEAKLATQCDRRRFLHQHRVGPAIDHPAIHPLGGDDTARARRGFQDDDGVAPLAQLVCGRKTGDATANDRDVNRRHNQCSVSDGETPSGRIERASARARLVSTAECRDRD